MMNQLPVRQCRYCGGEDIRVGWQSDALVTFKRNGLLGNRIKFLICGNCGAILYQCVAEPMYSFAKEEEERACRKAQANDENDIET